MHYKDFVDGHRVFYKTLVQCYCPALKEEVVFNSRGFYHLRYNGRGQERSVAEQIYRMKLLDNVVFVISNAQNIAEHRIVKSENGGEKIIEYWALRMPVGDRQVSVILRRIGDGNITFFSIWKGKSKKTAARDDPF